MIAPDHFAEVLIIDQSRAQREALAKLERNWDVSPIDAEIADRVASGGELVSVAEMDRRFRQLGYRLDRSGDCRPMARVMTGPRTGETYPCCTTWAVEVDTGIGFANVAGRRDANWRAFMELRKTLFAVSRGAILEV